MEGGQRTEQTTNLFDHDAAEVAMLEGAEGMVLLCQVVGELYVELVQL